MNSLSFAFVLFFSISCVFCQFSLHDPIGSISVRSSFPSKPIFKSSPLLPPYLVRSDPLAYDPLPDLIKKGSIPRTSWMPGFSKDHQKNKGLRLLVNRFLKWPKLI